MYFINSGDVDSLLGWFRSEDSYFRPADEKPDYLCLIVAGNFRFNKFFEDFGNSLETFDLITGKSIGLFLYSEKVQFALKGRISEHNGLGLHLGPKPKKSGLWNYSQVDIKDIRENLRRDAYDFSKKVIDYFELSPGDYPCLLILGKNTDKPLLLSLKHESDHEYIFRFFSDLAKVMDNHKELVSWSARYRDLPVLIKSEQDKFVLRSKQQKSIQEKVDEAKSTHDKQVSLMVVELTALGVENKLAAETLQVQAGQFTTRLGLNSHHKPADAISPHVEAIRTAFYEGSLKQQIKDCKATQYQYNSIFELNSACNREIRHITNNIQRYDSELSAMDSELDTISLSFAAAEHEIEQLVDRYNNKFTIREKYKKLKSFVEEICSWIKQTKEVSGSIGKLK